MVLVTVVKMVVVVINKEGRNTVACHRSDLSLTSQACE